MPVKTVALKTKADITKDKTKKTGGIDLYLKRIFAFMFGAVALTAVASYMTIWGGWFIYLINIQTGGFTALYYILLFGGLALSIWAQVRAFSFKPATGALLLGIYSILMGVVMTPLIVAVLAVNPASILFAFIIAAVMFACMALFGYKTVKDLSFMGIFLMMGMIGLILIGIASFIWPAIMGGTFGTIVCFIGVLIFALFTAYDMQNLKRAYAVIGDDKEQFQEFFDFIWKGKRRGFSLIDKDMKDKLFVNFGLDKKLKASFADQTGMSTEEKRLDNLKRERTKREESKKLLFGQVSALKNLKREIEEFAKETGRYEMFVGYPIVTGYIKGELQIKAPLILFPVVCIDSYIHLLTCPRRDLRSSLSSGLSGSLTYHCCRTPRLSLLCR